MIKEIVGKIDEYDVLYLPEKDLIYCKNTTMPYSIMQEALIKSPLDRTELKKDLIVTINGESVQLACLTTTIENIKSINKNIKKIKTNGRRTIKTKG